MKRLALALLASAFVVPAHADVALPVKIYAQHLADEAIAKNPDLLVIMMHVTPPGAADNIVVASNIGRIGKLGDEDDMRVITTGKPNLEIAHNGTRFEVELVMQDMGGNTIGAMGLVFPYKDGDDKEKLRMRAEGIRDAMNVRTLNTANLLESYPLDKSATTKTHAQKLVDGMLKKHPEVLLLAMHVTPPKGSDNIIIASNIGRIGKKADEDDLKVIATGAPHLAVNEAAKRFSAELVLQDAAGKTIGAIGIGLPYSKGDDQAALIKKAEGVRDEFKAQIPTIESIMELDP